MWPHKKGLGVRLSYGVYGNALVSIDTVPKAQDYLQLNEETFVSSNLDQPSDELDLYTPYRTLFPRINEEGDKLEFKSEKSTQIVESQTSKFTINSSMYDNLRVPAIPKSTTTPKSATHDYIPQEIILSYLVESKTLTSNIAYDPNCGDILQMFDMYVKEQNAYVDAMAFVTGEATSVLNIVLCEHPDEKFVMSAAYQLDFFDPILQIQVSDRSDKIAIIAVRTAAKVFILSAMISRIGYIQDVPSIELLIVGEVTADSLNGHSFADVKFDNKEFPHLAITDFKGNFTVYKVNKKVNNISMSILETMKEMDDNGESLSSWRRIFWVPKDSNKLLVLSRLKVDEITLTGSTATSRTLITSNTWSRIRDFTVIGNYGFMLTSKELIWFGFTDGMTRLLSWKHFLNDKDPSLKLTILSGSNTFTCLVYSQINPCIIVYTFGMRNDKPYSLRDPYILRKTHDNSELRQVMIRKVGKTLIMFELTTDLAIHSRTLIVGGSGAVTSGDRDGYSSLAITSNIGQNSKITAKFFKQFSQKQIQGLLKMLNTKPHSQDIATESQQIELIQKYAYELGSGFARIGDSQTKIARYFSLFDVCSDPPFEIRDILELDDMIVQLELSLPADKLKLKSLINNSFIQRSKFQNDATTQTHINDIYKLINNVYLKDENSRTSKIAVSILLGLSLIKCQYESNLFTDELEEAISEAPLHVKSLVEQWDDDDDDDQNTTQSGNQIETSVIEPTQATQHDSQFMPSIRLNSLMQAPSILTQSSQTQTQTQTQSQSQSQSQSQIPLHSQRLSSSSRMLSSQLGSSSTGVRRKRKRKGGFA